MVEIGAQAVFVRYETEWFHEKVTDEELEGKIFGRIEKMSDLIDWLKNSELRLQT